MAIHSIKREGHNLETIPTQKGSTLGITKLDEHFSSASQETVCTVNQPCPHPQRTFSRWKRAPQSYSTHLEFPYVNHSCSIDIREFEIAPPGLTSKYSIRGRESSEPETYEARKSLYSASYSTGKDRFLKEWDQYYLIKEGMSAVFQAGVLATKAVEMFSFSHASKQRVVPGIPICLYLSKARSKVPVLEMQHHSLGLVGRGSSSFSSPEAYRIRSLRSRIRSALEGRVDQALSSCHRTPLVSKFSALFLYYFNYIIEVCPVLSQHSRLDVFPQSSFEESRGPRGKIKEN